ncbi:MAG: FAD-dependent oxidoreductase [Candidatus Nealsonbacteria bacterium]|nr:FAD-dependent oxidoreductase [Candidatus Nealsonbacteria bacterium]
MADTYDLIIIGGGPAGIAAGIYGARKALKILLLTKDFIGQTGKTAWVENYPGFLEISGSDLMGKFKEHLQKFPVEIKEGEKVKSLVKKESVFEIGLENNGKYLGQAVIVAGGRKPRLLNIPGEAEFSNKGVSYCSICDAPLFKNKEVVVVGGGNAGFEAAIDLLPYAQRISILEIGAKVIADEMSQRKVEGSGRVEIILEAKALEIKGKKFVEGLIYQNLKSGEVRELSVQGIFVQIGSLPMVEFLKDSNLVEFNQSGEIVVDPKTGATRTAGLFAAGDTTDVKYKQIGVAVGEGIKAALSAHEHLQRQ